MRIIKNIVEYIWYIILLIPIIPSILITYLTNNGYFSDITSDITSDIHSIHFIIFTMLVAILCYKMLYYGNKSREYIYRFSRILFLV